MVKHLQELNVDKIKRQFLSIDENGSGKISLFDLRNILQDPDLTLAQDDIANLITEYDCNRSGTKEWDICEFLSMMSNDENKEILHKAIVLRSAIRNEFKQFDMDGEGHISTNDFRDVMVRYNVDVTKEQLDAMIKHADISGNGRIDYDEFVMLMSKLERCESCFNISVFCSSHVV